MGEGALHKVTLFLVCKASKLAAGWTRDCEPSELKTIMKRVLYKVTKSARLSEQPGGACGRTCWEAWPGSRPVDAKWDAMYTFTGLGKDQGKHEDVEKGQ